MMTSTYPSKNGLREIESKKEALNTLETALKKRVTEFKELCLKEGELTGHLPVDYPLQPREPIPQIRRRIKHNNCTSSSSSSSTISGNNAANLICDNFNIAHPVSIKSREHRLPNIQPQAAFAINQNANLPFPSRPTSTNSTSSSISTASSNNRNGNNNIIHNPLNVQHLNGHQYNPSIASSSSTQLSSMNNGFSNLCNDQCSNKLLRNHRQRQQPVQFDSSLLPNHFKKPFNLPSNPSFDSDALGHMRASSTASSSSSSGSGASSTLSAPTVPNLKNSASLNSMTNLHARSYSENIAINPVTFRFSTNSNSKNPYNNSNDSNTHTMGQHQTFNIAVKATNQSSCPPPRPPRGLNHNNAPHQTSNENSKINGDNHAKTASENTNSSTTVEQKNVDIPQIKPTQRFRIDGVANFQPYYEETKPFQMSDFYKYSSKHRQRVNEASTTTAKSKTTRQLQEEVSKKYSLKLPSCDDQIQASVKLIEKSGQKLMEATAKAIAGNPGLAEQINNILPNNGDRY